MDLLFTDALILDPARGVTHGTLAVRDGRVLGVHGGPQEVAGATVIDCGGRHLAPGIVDLGVKVGEPGERHRESFATAGRAAAAGGVTTMVTRPDTEPPLDTPEALEFVARRAERDAVVRVAPMAALTKGRHGREMTEIGFLRDAGAVAFGDGDRVVSDARVMARAMTYAASLGALVVGHPQDPGLSSGACATSGPRASLMGLPAVSPMAERMGLDRDVALVEMTGAAYHADQITCARALPALARAKRNGFDVTAGVGIHHLTLNDNDIAGYRTFFKLKPPLRPEEDRAAVVEALSEGLIDIVGSMHTPQDADSKRLPFEEAAAGAVALETLLPAALRLHHSDGVDLTTLWRAMSLAPADRLGLPQGRLEAGAPADLLLFDADAPFVLDRATLLSRCKNTPFDGARMQGRVLGTWVGGARVFGGDA
ncbi:MAG: dihydroorotase [Paracoccaceae bacterium]